MRPNVIALTLALAASLAAPSTARGFELSLVDSLYSKAERAYLQGDFATAASSYAATLERIDEAGDGAPAYLDERRRSARLLLARSLERRGRCDEALDVYEAALSESPFLSDAIAIRMAECLRAEDRFPEAVLALRTVVDAPERTTLYTSAVEALGDLHRKAGDYDVAIQWYRVLLSELSAYDDRARVRYKIGLALRDRGDESAAREVFAEVVEDFPRSRHAFEALETGRGISRAFTERYYQGLVLYNRGRYREAAEFFTYHIRHDGSGANLAEASYFRGRSHQRMGSFGSAVGDYEEVIEHGTGSEYYELAWSKLAYCMRATGRVEESLAKYEEFARVHPESNAAPDMLWERGRLLEEELRWDDAAAVYEDLGARYPVSERASGALFRAGLCLFKLSRYGEAEQAFADLPAGDGADELARAFFWAGKCREALGETEAAVARYDEAVEAAPDSYYGRRAAYRVRNIELPSDSSASSSDDVEGAPSVTSVSGALRRGDSSANPRVGSSSRPETGWRTPGTRPQLPYPFRRVSGLQDFAAWLAEWYHLVYLPGERVELARMLRSEPAFRRADAFMSLHMTTEAHGELSLLEDMYGSDPRMLDVLIGYYEGCGLHRRAIRLAEWILDLSPAETISEAPPYLRGKICPEHFRNTVRAECAVRGIDPALFYSLMRQESLFEPDAVSWVGARGLSQIMPSTGIWVARRLGVRGFRTRDLLDPELNIRFGTYYLAEQREEFEGDVMKALAAYNGGPENVDRWWGYGGGADTDVFVEDIGYAQTNDYVRRVFLYGEFYRELGSGW